MSTYEHPRIEALCQAIQAIPGRAQMTFEFFVWTGLALSTAHGQKGGLAGAKLVNELWEGKSPRSGSPPNDIQLAACVRALKAYSAAVEALPPFTHVLGAVHALTLARKRGERLGQFFMPEDACELQAKLAADGLERHPWRGKGHSRSTILHVGQAVFCSLTCAIWMANTLSKTFT